MKGLLIIGAGGHGRAVAEAVLLARSHSIAAFLDDAPDRAAHIGEIPIWGATSDLPSWLERVEEVVVAIGRNATREALHARIAAAGVPLAQVVHPNAIVSPSALIGRGCVVMAGAIIGAQAQLGEGVIVNCGAIIDHDCRIEAFGHLGVGACMAGGAMLGHGAWMQAGSALGYGVKVAAGCVLKPGEGVSR